jgi:hypothetical protein
LSCISRRIVISDLLAPIEKFGHVFGVRTIRPEGYVVGPHESDEAVEVVLPEQVDPDASQEGVAACSRISSVVLGTLSPGVWFDVVNAKRRLGRR